MLLYKQGRLKVKDKVKGGIGMLWRAGSHHQVYIKFTSSDKWYLASALKSWRYFPVSAGVCPLGGKPGTLCLECSSVQVFKVIPFSQM